MPGRTAPPTVSCVFRNVRRLPLCSKWLNSLLLCINGEGTLKEPRYIPYYFSLSSTLLNATRLFLRLVSDTVEWALAEPFEIGVWEYLPLPPLFVSASPNALASLCNAERQGVTVLRAGACLVRSMHLFLQPEKTNQAQSDRWGPICFVGKKGGPSLLSGGLPCA